MYLFCKSFKMYKRITVKYYFILILPLLILVAGCASSEKSLYVLPIEFRVPEKKAEFLKFYSPYIIGKKFFLDPGHGGNDRNNVGYKGTAVEADVNLNVALLLSRFIKEAGGIVLLSRNKDTSIDLKDRSLIANKSNADFFISIHHNAPGSKEDIWTNYTSTYYHAKESDYEYEPCQYDIAKYIQRDLSYAMRNSGGLGSFDGTYSDYNIYPSQGFSVLRLSKIPAVLVECGFTTSQFESSRISLKEFNAIEAWGIFRGLCRYLSNGIPEIRFIKTERDDSTKSMKVNFALKDSAGIDLKSIKVYSDSALYKDYIFNPLNTILSIFYPSFSNRKHVIKITAANLKGNYAFPFYYNIFVENKMDN
jgi:N-acetylmuramoyl-L-alanine amidase